MGEPAAPRGGGLAHLHVMVVPGRLSLGNPWQLIAVCPFGLLY
jgi:hypothetical protein